MRKIICISLIFTAMLSSAHSGGARNRKAAPGSDTTFTLALTDSTGAVQIDSVTSFFLDSVYKKPRLLTNDYTTVGFQYGVAMNQMMFNPAKSQKQLMTPVNFGLLYTRYGKLFGYMPYFGIRAGVFYGQDGYKFKTDLEEGDTQESVDGATKATYTFIEVPAMAHLHVDVWRVKFFADAGLYGAYRYKVEREGKLEEEKYKDHFYSYDNKLDYGLKFAGGLAFMLDPVEIEVQVGYKYSWGSLYDADYHSSYYYRYAYPSDLSISLGLHFQLTKRNGKTRAQLREEARRAVYGTETEK